uniref:Transmembrane protein 17 n=1 Tax=Zonotrichia albicollis TaxID=44394 RepID=A0A8D2QGG8_ZONAL
MGAECFYSTFSRANIPVTFSENHRVEEKKSPRTNCEILSSLPLQMSLYFNVYFFPFWWLITVAILYMKYPALSDYYKFILVTIMILVSLTELIRLYLGYVGNLLEKVPELAGFWLLTLLPQLPIILFLLFNEGLKIHSLERAVHIIFAAFLSFQVVAAFFALRRMVSTLATRFRLTEFHRLEEQRPSCLEMIKVKTSL